MDLIQQLTSGYLDGELSDEQAAQLSDTITTDAASLDLFVLGNVIHSQILDLMDEQRLQDRAIGGSAGESARDDLLPRPSSMVFDGLRKPVFDTPWRHASNPRRSHLQTWGALTAAMLVAASIATVSYVIASRPTYVGTLTEATVARWGTAPANIAVGAFLQEGQDLELLSGTAVVTFSSGAKLYMEGPATLRVDSPKDVQLVSGQIAAKVPRPAMGFTVHSSLADFIDLGTAFSLKLDAEKTFQLHVFEGLVEVRLNERFGAAAQLPARIAEVFAVTFDVKVGDIHPFPFEEGKKMPF